MWLLPAVVAPIGRRGSSWFVVVRPPWPLAAPAKNFEILCKAGEAPCTHSPGARPHDEAAKEIFRQNAAVLSPH